MSAILEFRDVHYAYPNSQESLKGVNFIIPEGAKIALVGPNGAGKTTLILSCNGILKPTSGEVLFRNRPLTYDRRSLRELRKKIGLVFQNSDAQLFAPTVHQDVAFGPVNLGIGREQVRALVQKGLAAVGLIGYDRRPPHLLSGGEKKKAAIAGVLVMEPDLLIFDEPTSSLDPAGAADLMELLDELNIAGKTILISTHDIELAYQWADLVILMNDGLVVHQGPPEEVFMNPALIAATNLRTPAVLETFTELVARKILSGSRRAPRSVLHLVNCLEQGLDRHQHTPEYGTIAVCNVDTVPASTIKTWLMDHPDHRKGAMGTRAKHLAAEEGYALDYTYDVIDKCILRALIGESSLILTSTGMVPRVERRVLAFDEESGIRISVDMTTLTESSSRTNR